MQDKKEPKKDNKKNLSPDARYHRRIEIFLVFPIFSLAVIYLLLMLPLFSVTPILGVGSLPWHQNYFLSKFEIFWQPICAVFYFLAGAELLTRDNFSRKRLFCNLAVGCSLIEALVLNIYLPIATRVQIAQHGIFIDGIFTSKDPYSLFGTILYIAIPLFSLILVNLFFAKPAQSADQISKKTSA
ncbi:MAG: hypothetical protein WAW91_03600 [Candidatus Nanoperiomorbaceae bacterium]